MRWLRAVLTVGVTAVLMAASGQCASAGPAPSGGFFVVTCSFSHSAPDDPIVFPRLPAHSHDHGFFGNVSTDAFSTPASLPGHATTCSDTDDRSAYWAPTLYAAGVPVIPLGVTIYYRRQTRAAVHPFPSGLEMVAGNSHALVPQSPAVTQWYCSDLKSSFNYGPLRRPLGSKVTREPAPSLSDASLPRCSARANLELQVNFPDCSNGQATSADHRSHMAYSVAGRCPASHPIPVPAISIILRYPLVAGSNIFLASGGINSGHADFMDAWRAKPFAELVASCLNHYLNCGAAASGALDVT